MLEDLARSGLTNKDAKLMCVSEFDGAKVKRLTKHYNSTAYALPYFDTKGKLGSFFRLRFLEKVTDLRTGKPIRYWQPPKTQPQVYFPPCVKWAEVLKDTSQPIIITEGEKKAYAGAKILKRPVIGLGGVWSWGSKSERVVVLPELVPFLKDREILLCFDHDPVPNPDVTMALHSLARAARGFGASTRCLPLPALAAGEKAGLDDVLVKLGPDAVLGIEPTSFDDVAALEGLNNELAYIENAGAVYHIPTHALLDRPQRLTSVIYSCRSIVRYDAKGNAVEKNLAGEWLKWPQRRTHKSLAYKPGGQPMLEDGSLNVWPGFAVEPKRGDVSPYLKLLDQVFVDDKDGLIRKWVLQWLAYPLVHPGTKLYSAVLMHSRVQGVGKSLLGLTMQWIYGDNFVSLEAGMLHGNHNGWARHRQFILGDEVTSRDRRDDADRLKNLVTQETVTINEKFQVPYRLPDVANIWLTSNHPDALSLDADDRRWLIWEITRKLLPDDWFQNVYHHWVRRPENAAAVMYYLMKQDLKGFAPRGRAPVTEAKADMQSISDGFADYSVREFLAAPDRTLLGQTRDLYMAGEIAALIDPSGRTHPVTVAKALRRAGSKAIPPTKTMRGTVRLYAVRNTDKWTAASHQERAAHYDGVLARKAK